MSLAPEFFEKYNQELTQLRAKVRELEAEIAGYHKVMDELKADCKCDACLENRAIVAEERVKELEQRLEALEAQHNLKGR